MCIHLWIFWCYYNFFSVDNISQQQQPKGSSIFHFKLFLFIWCIHCSTPCYVYYRLHALYAIETFSCINGMYTCEYLKEKRTLNHSSEIQTLKLAYMWLYVCWCGIKNYFFSYSFPSVCLEKTFCFRCAQKLFFLIEFFFCVFLIREKLCTQRDFPYISLTCLQPTAVVCLFKTDFTFFSCFCRFFLCFVQLGVRACYSFIENSRSFQAL